MNVLTFGFHTGRTCFYCSERCLFEKENSDRKLHVQIRIVFIITANHGVNKFCDDYSSENLLVGLVGFHKNLDWRLISVCDGSTRSGLNYYNVSTSTEGLEKRSICVKVQVRNRFYLLYCLKIQTIQSSVSMQNGFYSLEVL